MHKKKYLYFFTGFLVLLLTVFVSSLGSTLAVDFNDYYNFDSGDLYRAYQFWRQQSVDVIPEYYSEYNSIISTWEEADKVFSGELERNWAIIASTLNETLYNNFNSKTDTANYEDRNLLCLFIPSMNLGNIGASGQQVMWFMFIPYPYRTLKATETRGSQTVNGQTEYYYSYKLRLGSPENLTEINTNISNTTNNFLLMSVPLNTAQPIGFIVKEGTNNQFFTQWTKYYRSKYSWSMPHMNAQANYAYGIFKTFRDYLEVNGARIWWSSYDLGGAGFAWSRIYYYFDLENNVIYDSENAPQEPSSGDSGDFSGEGIDLTETNTLLGNLSTDLTSTPGSGDFNMISSGDIVSSLGGFQISLPLADFWNYLITNLRDCLDYTGTASLHIQTVHFERTLYPSDFAFTFPEPLQTFIPALWTFIALLVLLKYSYSIYKGIASGDALSVAGKISNEDIDEIL